MSLDALRMMIRNHDDKDIDKALHSAAASVDILKFNLTQFREGEDDDLIRATEEKIRYLRIVQDGCYLIREVLKERKESKEC